ncbi:hypothetical protein SMICM304S_02413 [Streptomyces microflavus]
MSWNELHIGDVAKLPLDSKGEIKFPAITQEGQAVFRWAVYEMAKVAQQALDAAGISRRTWTSSSRTRPTCGSSTRW